MQPEGMLRAQARDERRCTRVSDANADDRVKSILISCVHPARDGAARSRRRRSARNPGSFRCA